MTPDEEANVASEQPPAAPVQSPRRSRRGGRRHSRRRGHPGAGVAAPRPEFLPPAEASGLPAERESERTSESEPRPAGTRHGSGVMRAIELVGQIIEELKRVLDEMEEVLETLEVVERQKTEDEREIESLHQALRRLRRPEAPGHRRH